MLLLIFVVEFILYRNVLGTYFSGDDFFHFQVSQTDGTLLGFLKLFGFYSFSERAIAFYRPIFREILYHISYSIFGLNSSPLRILQFLIHFLNTYLAYVLIKNIFKDRKVALFSSFFFGITTANVAAFYYLAGGIQAMGATMFILLSIIFFHKYLEKKNTKLKIASFATFLLGLASHELGVVGLPLITGLIYLKEKNFEGFLKRTIKEIYIPIIFTVIYLYFDLRVIGFSKDEIQYRPILGIKNVINSLGWYLGWALGLPEMLIDFVSPGFKLNPNLMKYFGNYFKVIFPSFFVSFGILFFGAISLLKNKDLLRNSKFWFFVFWFPLAIAPVIFLPLHKSTYYLVVSLPAFWAVVGYIAFKIKEKSKILFWMLTISLITLSTFSINLGEKTYWAVSRGRIAKKLINEIKSKYPVLPKGAVVYFVNDPSYPFISGEWGGTSKQAYYALSNDDALQLLYKDKTLKVYFEDVNGKPQKVSKDELFVLTAEIQ